MDIRINRQGHNRSLALSANDESHSSGIDDLVVDNGVFRGMNMHFIEVALAHGSEHAAKKEQRDA